MSTEYVYDRDRLEEAKARFTDADHKAGCPAKPHRLEAEVQQGPEEEAEVDTGRLYEGRPVRRKTMIPGPFYLVTRCQDCGADKHEQLDDSDELAMRRGLGEQTVGEVL